MTLQFFWWGLASSYCRGGSIAKKKKKPEKHLIFARFALSTRSYSVLWHTLRCADQSRQGPEMITTIVAIPDSQNFHQKVQTLSIIKSKYLYTRRKVSVSSVERSPLVVANSVDAEVTCVFTIPISIERK